MTAIFVTACLAPQAAAEHGDILRAHFRYSAMSTADGPDGNAQPAHARHPDMNRHRRPAPVRQG